MKSFSSYIILVVGFFAAFFAPPPHKRQAPANQGTQSFARMLDSIYVAVARPVLRGMMLVQLQIDRVFGMRTPFALGITIDEQIAKSLEGLNEKLARLDTLQKAVEKNGKDYEDVTRIVKEVQVQLNDSRKMQIGLKSNFLANVDHKRALPVSLDCARHLGALGFLAALKAPQADIPLAQKDYAVGVIKEMLGLDAKYLIEGKSALTTSDIPLPTQYMAEVVELVYQFGQARKHGTVFPLGAGTVKLPKLTTDTAWGLIAMSGTVTEVSPAFSFTTFTPEKFGGLIRLPTELDEDSIVALGAFIARYGARNLAKVEDYQFFMSTGAGSGVNGTGKGLVKYAIDDACKIVQGSGLLAQSEATLQNFRDLRGISTLSGIVLNNAKYYMHPTYEALLCTFNTSATVTPYQRATPGSPAMLDGFPIEWINVMTPLSATDSASLAHVLFGDVTYQYLGIRGGPRFDTSREAAFATDEVLIRGLERLTVGAMASKAVAALATAAS